MIHVIVNIKSKSTIEYDVNQRLPWIWNQLNKSNYCLLNDCLCCFYEHVHQEKASDSLCITRLRASAEEWSKNLKISAPLNPGTMLTTARLPQIGEFNS